MSYMNTQYTSALAAANKITAETAEKVLAGEVPLDVDVPVLPVGLVSATVYESGGGGMIYREHWHAPWGEYCEPLPARFLLEKNDDFPEFRAKFIELMREGYGRVYHDLVADNIPEFMPRRNPTDMTDDEFIEHVYQGTDDVDDPLFFDPDAVDWLEGLEEILVEKEPSYDGGCSGASVAVALPPSMSEATVAELRSYLRSVAPGTVAVQSIAGADPNRSPVIVPASRRDYIGPYDWVDSVGVEGPGR